MSPNSSLESYIHIPVSDGNHCLPANTLGTLNSFCPTNNCPVSINKSKPICGHISFKGGCPILWKTHKENCISHSSCEAEVKTTNGRVMYAQMYHHVLSDLHILDPSSPIPVYNDNKVLVDCSNSFSTKGMRRINTHENAIREACLLN